MNLDFIILEGDATSKAIEDDIVADLAKVGINVTTRMLAKDPFNTAMVAGDFNMAFSESQGPPYDPQAFAASWSTPDEAYYAALKGLPAPNTQAVLSDKIKAALTKTTETDRTAAWKEILTALHDQATEVPISGKRIPAIINKRLTGYQSGYQQFDYPAHTLTVASGSDTITVAPGAQGGLMSKSGIGRLDPHTYRPNEFFANNWVYEGLTSYGQDGVVVPALATSWTVADKANGGQTYTFTLRTGVKFHDGEDWNCAVAKLNFDHVMVKPMTTGDWHGWYQMPGQLDGWSCDGEKFLLHTKSKYYPLLQELSFIRPLRMQSPKMFIGGLTSDPLTQNSCHVGWGNITDFNMTVQCKGIVGGGIGAGGSVAGTGRWKYVETVKSGSDVKSIKFERFTGHWEPPTGKYVKVMNLVYYASHDAVKAALLDKSLDAVLGAGVLTEKEVANFKSTQANDFTVVMTAPLQNRIVVLNTAKAPTNDLTNRKVIIHAVNKAAIIEKEMAGLAEAATTLFPKSAPYCNIDKSAKYDLAEAERLNCPSSGAIGGGAGLMACFLAIVGFLAHM